MIDFKYKFKSNKNLIMEEVTPEDNVNSIVNLNENNGTFATGIDYIGENKNEKEKEKELTLPPIKNSTPPKSEESKEEVVTIKSPTFFEVYPPQFNPNDLSLPIPVDIIKIKKMH